MSDDDSNGTIIRGATGDLYFVREEVLQACKITEPEMQAFCAKLVDDLTEVDGFSFSFGQANRSVALRGPFAGNSVSTFNAAAESTVMCPGSMKDASFQVLPAEFRSF
jgi:hypothetical protein